ncbi:hypothetical protein QTJ16_000841 [Diplocarpon rosae]|uniref:Uncharacterized protein n=1 Tax=Diplocarpon rosae TaxID=946125 RepID=A0AAD9T5M9_9HELO|nr:hypothetical protein QTJ16_000841 [Diplocarpon rosae]
MFISKILLIISAGSLVTAPPPPVDPYEPIRSKESSPNPIKGLFPHDVTGNFNGTFIVVPIDYTLARSIVPAEWAINKDAYRSLLPDLPRDRYPLVVRAGVSHDIGSPEYVFDDLQTVHVTFPFVDLLGDGYSSFSYNQYRILASLRIDISGHDSYKTMRVPGSMTPNLEAYDLRKLDRELYRIELNVFTENFNTVGSPKEQDKTVSFTMDHFTSYSVTSNQMDFLKNVTNQPTFTDGELCNHQMFLYDTVLSTGDNAPEKVRGSITLAAPLLPVKNTYVTLASGLKFSAAFRDFHNVPCAKLQGFHYTESAVYAPFSY